MPCIITSWEENDPHIGIERTHPWNYAANKEDHGQENQTSLVCLEGDTTCYFLPYHGCGPIDMLKNDSSVKLLQFEEGNKGGDVAGEGMESDNDDGGEDDEGEIWSDEGWSAYSFVTRKQLWFRRAVFDYKEKFKQEYNWSTKSDCTVMHARRADAILDDRH